MTREQAERIVDALLDNLTVRKGFDDVWDACAEDVRIRLRQAWIGIVLSEVAP